MRVSGAAELLDGRVRDLCCVSECSGFVLAVVVSDALTAGDGTHVSSLGDCWRVLVVGWIESVDDDDAVYFPLAGGED